MFKIIKLALKFSLKVLSATLGFATAMALGPGLMLFMYLYEPHNPLPDIISELPAEKIEASQVLQNRVDLLLDRSTEIPDITGYLDDKGFNVDLAGNNAVYRRRQLNCIESYVVVWTERDDKIDEVATLVETRCPGIAKNI